MTQRRKVQQARGGRRRPAPSSRKRPEAGKQLRLSVKTVEAEVPYTEVLIREPVTEDSMVQLFERARIELARREARRVLVDLRDAEVRLSISDLNGLAKMIIASFGATVERLAVVLRPADLPAEKFFEPSMRNRGLPTFATVDLGDAIDWLMAKARRKN